MADLEGKQEVERASDGQGTVRTVMKIIEKASKILAYVITGQVGKSDTPHPDFRLVSNYSGDFRWYQNSDWGPVPDPPFKVGFYFNDPSVLNECPWVCKIGKNLNENMPNYKYFAVAYGAPHLYREGYGLADMTQWAMQFNHPSLMTYKGKLLKMLKQ